MDLAGLSDDVSVFADHRSQGGRSAVAKHHDRAPAGPGGDGGHIAQECRARFAVIHGGRGKAASLQGGEQALKTLGVFRGHAELIAAAAQGLGVLHQFPQLGKLVGRVFAAAIGGRAGRGLGRLDLVRSGGRLRAAFRPVSPPPSAEESAASAFFSHWSMSWCICSGVTIIVPFLISRKTSGSPASSRSWKSLWNLRKSSGLAAALAAAVLPAGGGRHCRPAALLPLGNQPIDVAGRDVEAAALHEIADFRIAGQQPLQEQFAESLEFLGVGQVAGVQVGGTADRLAGQKVVPLFAIGIDRHVLILVDVHADVGMDADHAAIEIEQRSAGIAGDDRGIGDEESRALARIEDASQADGRRAALLDAAGMAQGHAPGARPDVVGMAHLDVRPLAGLGDLGEAGIAREIRAQGLGCGAAAIGEDHRQLAPRLGDDVADGEDQAVFAHHHAASLAQAAVAGQRQIDDSHRCPEDPRGHGPALRLDPLEHGHGGWVAGLSRTRDEAPQGKQGDENAEATVKASLCFERRAGKRNIGSVQRRGMRGRRGKLFSILPHRGEFYHCEARILFAFSRGIAWPLPLSYCA